jgi:hypothetical protein
MHKLSAVEDTLVVITADQLQINPFDVRTGDEW